MLWGYMAVSFPWLQTAESLPEGEFLFFAVSSQPESEIVAAVSLSAGVLWIDEFIMHDGIGVAFGPFHRYAVLEPGNFPYWHLVASGTWNGQRSDFNFPKFAFQASADDP
jgi:hypothetical protein